MYMCTSYTPIYELPVCASTANTARISSLLFYQMSTSTLRFRGARPAVTAMTPSHVGMLRPALGARKAQLELDA